MRLETHNDRRHNFKIGEATICQNTSRLCSSERNMASQPGLSEIGRTATRSNISEPVKAQENATTLSAQSMNNSVSRNPKKRKNSSTQGFRVPSNETTSDDKSKNSHKRIRRTRSSQTCARGSTSSGRVCRPFWNTRSEEWSKKLWLPTRTDCADLDLTSCNTSLQRHALNSWYTVRGVKQIQRPNKNWQKICSQLPPCLLPETTAKGLPKTEKDDNGNLIIKAIKVRLMPNTEERLLLNQWLNMARWTYNKCVEFSKQRDNKVTLKNLRAAFINNSVLPDWAIDKAPYEVRDAAMRDFVKARKICLQKYKTSKHKFSMKYRSKKDFNQSFEVRHRDWGNKRGAYAWLKKIVCSEKSLEHELPKKIDMACRFVKNKLGHWYISIPIIGQINENQVQSGQHTIVSIDPGVRTFATCYDTGGRCFHWGEQATDRIFRLCYRIDKLIALRKSVHHKHRTIRNMKRRELRLRLKIRHMVADMHRHLAKWLCENYRRILLPKFEVQSMIKRGNRKLSSKTVRRMCTLSHYKFRQILMNKTREYPHTKVILVDEPYTSKTCGQCGQLNNKLGGRKVFVCDSCGYKADRDVNGARNILIRYLTLTCQ